jgi:uncharacterized protein YdeI (YjbR/CyaY-like superfamily)
MEDHLSVRYETVVRKKGFEGCWKCTEFETYTKLDLLTPVHDDAHIKNLNIIAKKEQRPLFKGREIGKITHIKGDMINRELAKALLFKNRDEWRSWLEKNHTIFNGVWLIHYKKSSGNDSLNHFNAVEEALCFGWIDSKLKKIDDERFILKYSPRKSKSVWSKINKETAEKMISLGKMTQSGFDRIEDAKKQGFWDTAYTSLVKERLPSDLKKALIGNKTAWINFQHFANSYRNMYIGWVKSAKTKETRKKRISEVVKRSLKNKKPG